MRLDKKLRDVTLGYIQKFDELQRSSSGVKKTEDLLALKNSTEDFFSKQLAKNIILAGAAVVTLLVFPSLFTATPLAILGASAVAVFGGLQANRADQNRYCKSILSEKINQEVLGQLASENEVGSSSQLLLLKSLKNEFNHKADANVRFEELRSIVSSQPSVSAGHKFS